MERCSPALRAATEHWGVGFPGPVMPERFPIKKQHEDNSLVQTLACSVIGIRIPILLEIGSQSSRRDAATSGYGTSHAEV